jgi:transposase InsO family protein
LRGCLLRLALDRVADAEAGSILGDDAWAEAALALGAEHTRVLADLERARAAAAAGPQRMRAAHRSWGPRRLVFELERRGHPGVSRSTVYRMLVRHRLIGSVSPRRRRGSYRRWERPAAMELWQMDVTASLFLADGRECKVITGIDDHSRFCVIATVVMRATARAVCLAFTAAMAEHGIPGEVLTDNGRQFTGRFGKPRPAEVLFERICRENGITQRLTKPRSPTTTGEDRAAAPDAAAGAAQRPRAVRQRRGRQVAAEAWRKDCNTRRPHQSLDMAFPAARFAALAADRLGLRIPAELSRPPQLPAASEDPVPDGESAGPPPTDPGSDSGQPRPWSWTGWPRRRATSGSPGSRSGSGLRRPGAPSGSGRG